MPCPVGVNLGHGDVMSLKHREVTDTLCQDATGAVDFSLYQFRGRLHCGSIEFPHEYERGDVDLG